LLLAARIRAIDEQWDDARALVADALREIDRGDSPFYTAMGYRRLGVGSRVEAAALAARTGLGDPSST
jgi:hypothetical protein